jgi:hypothetical protein
VTIKKMRKTCIQIWTRGYPDPNLKDIVFMIFWIMLLMILINYSYFYMLVVGIILFSIFLV